MAGVMSMLGVHFDQVVVGLGERHGEPVVLMPG